MPFLKTCNRISVKGTDVNRLKKGFCFLVIMLIPWIAASPLRALQTEFRGGPVNIDADNITYDGDEDVYHAEGKVLITFTGGYLKADAVTLNHTTNQALAVGHVLVHSDQDILEGEKVSFNIVSRVGTVNDGTMFIAQNHFYIKGERIEKRAEATYHLENATVTSCDGDAPDWRIAGSELDVTVDGYGVVRNGRFLARNLPVLYLPYFIFPAKTKRQSGFLFPYIAYSQDRNGLDIELPFYWAVSESVDATFFQRYMEKRGFKEGIEFRYAPSPNTFGTFYGDFINDRMKVTENAGNMSRDWQENHNRWSYYLNHETTFANGFNLRSDIRRVSDRWYFRDFSSFNYYLDNYSLSGVERFRRISFLGDESLGSLNSTVRLTKDWSLYNLTALASYTDDFSSLNNNATLQQYPAVTVTGFRQPLFGSPLQLEFNSGYNYFYRQEGQKGHLLNISPTLSLPMKLGPSVQIQPQVGFRGDVWQRSDSLTDDGDKYGDREVFAFGTTLSTGVYRVFDVKGTEVEKIKHGISTGITYSFIPEASQSRLPDFLGWIAPQNSLSYWITNTLLARMRGTDGKISYREMMRFRLAQTYDIREARRDVPANGNDNRPFSDVYLELDLNPVRYVTLAARNVYSVNSGVWWQNNYDLTLYDNRGDSVSAGYRYTKNTLEEINLSLRAALTSSLGATYVLRRNKLDGKTVESSYGLQYRKQCWTVDLYMTDRTDDRTVMVMLSLYGVGSVNVNKSFSSTPTVGN
jgi:LPS-assembly protein